MRLAKFRMRKPWKTDKTRRTVVVPEQVLMEPDQARYPVTDGPVSVSRSRWSGSGSVSRIPISDYVGSWFRIPIVRYRVSDPHCQIPSEWSRLSDTERVIPIVRYRVSDTDGWNRVLDPECLIPDVRLGIPSRYRRAGSGAGEAADKVARASAYYFHSVPFNSVHA